MGSRKELISALEIEKHNSPDSLWIIVEGKVYDMTRFAPLHPGGVDILHMYAGRDATEVYADVHPPQLIISTLTPDEQLGDIDPATELREPIDSSGLPQVVLTVAPSKPSLETLFNADDFQNAAQRSLSRKNWAFINGASNDNITRDANHDYYRKVWFRPRILRDVSVVSTQTTLLGCKVSCPIFISAAGLATAGGPGGEVALSQAAAETGIIQTISTNSAIPLLEILDAAPEDHPFFFQLYVSNQRKQTEDLLRVVNSHEQIKAVFLTVDVPVVSKREDDEREKLEKFHKTAMSGITGQVKGPGLARQFGSFIDSTMNWSDLKWIKNFIKIPLVLKGIQSAADAMTAMQMGCDGIVVSNHGGRALDGAPPAILILLELRRHCPEVFDRMQVFIDGGVRRGSDVLKALCLGARGVGFGRPYMYALNYGKEGAVHLTNILKDEVSTAMQLAGITDLTHADLSMVNTAELDLLLPEKLTVVDIRSFGSVRRDSHL